jgi:hypothetical protein
MPEKDFADGTYETEIIPVDIRFNISPFKAKNWNPFFYAGAGVIHYQVNEQPTSVSRYAVEDEGTSGILSFGAGGQFPLSDVVLFELNLGITYSHTENLNFYDKHESSGDAYISLGAGLTFG